MAGRSGLKAAWIVHVVLLGVIGVPVALIGIALVKSGLGGHGDPFAAFGELLIGGVMILGAVIYALITTATLGGVTAFKAAKGALKSPPPASATPQPQPQPGAALRAGAKASLGIAGWHVAVIAGLVLGIPFLRRVSRARAQRAQRQANEKRVGKLNDCFDLSSWNLHWYGDGSHALLTVHGHAGVTATLQLSPMRYAGHTRSAEAQADEDVTLETDVFHGENEPYPADFSFQVRCPDGVIWYETQATSYQSILDFDEPRLIRPLFPPEP